MAKRDPAEPKDNLIAVERIEKRIFLLRGDKVMLSTDLAELYEVEPRVPVQAVKRNRDRFPEDFMFQLSKEEFQHLKITNCDFKLGRSAQGHAVCFH